MEIIAHSSRVLLNRTITQLEIQIKNAATFFQDTGLSGSERVNFPRSDSVSCEAIYRYRLRSSSKFHKSRNEFCIFLRFQLEWYLEERNLR